MLKRRKYNSLPFRPQLCTRLVRSLYSQFWPSLFRAQRFSPPMMSRSVSIHGYITLNPVVVRLVDCIALCLFGSVALCLFGSVALCLFWFNSHLSVWFNGPLPFWFNSPLPVIAMSKMFVSCYASSPDFILLAFYLKSFHLGDIRLILRLSR